MVFGRDMLLPFDTSIKPRDTLPKKVNSHMAAILDNLKMAEEIANKNIQEAQDKSKVYYDKTAREPEFSVGDRVLLHVPKVPKGVPKKLHRKEQGPYYITATGPNYTYRLRSCFDHKELPSLVHANRIKPYFDPSDRVVQPTGKTRDPTGKARDPSSGQGQLDTSSNDQSQKDKTPDVWKPVECILATKVMNSVRHYRVKWADGTPPSWEPVQNISEALLRAYHVTHTKTGKKRKCPLFIKS